MQKKIAILAKEKHNEAFRIAAGLTILDDTIDIFVLGNELEYNEQMQNSLKLAAAMDLKIYTNNPANKQMTYIPTDELAIKLLEYDLVDPC
ncbi:MAG: hypothetical protein JXR79_09210 [Nitrospirae bacterium]|nr:hypothetical protein [Nitrospirota bacterium]